MALDDATRRKIEHDLEQDRVVLFMKGSPRQPMCGFSAKTAGLLDSLLPSYTSVDVLEDPAIREGIKAYGDWPTIPQLYIDGELIGGCDIVTAMYNSGELHEQLGQEAPDRTPPEVTITDTAAEKIRAAMQGHEDVGLHFNVDADWQSQFNLAPSAGHEIRSEANGITLLFDLASAQRARGAVIDWVETVQGEGLTIDLPEAPAPVKAMDVTELKRRLDEGTILLIDVRPDEERQQASIDAARSLDTETMKDLEAQPKDTAMAFICHPGTRSRVVCEHFRKLGFTEIYTVEGGIDAWSKQVDSSVPLY